MASAANTTPDLVYGEQLLRRLEANPRDGAAYDAMGVFALEHASVPEAIDLFHRAIQLEGPEPRYCAHLGEAFARLGDYGRASACLGEAVLGEPANAELRMAYANLLHLEGDHAGAGKHYEILVAQSPAHAEAWFNLGVTRTFQQRPGEAKHAYENAVGARPVYAEAWNNLALLERLDGNYSAAEACYRRALLVRPDYRDALYNFAVLLQEQERLPEAVSIYERLLSAEASFSEAHNNLGNCYLKMNRLAEAKNQYLETLAIQATHKEAPWNLGFASLLSGDWQRGWAGYEHRLVQHEITRRQWDAPRWNGQLLRGQKILVHAEQGLGDTIQFARYLRLLDEGGMWVQVLCQPPLVSLLSQMPGVRHCTSNAEECGSGDWQVPFPSLPYHFRTRLENIPATLPYLLADPERVAEWRKLFAALPAAGRRIGVAWQGNPKHQNDRNRSIPVELLRPLFELPGQQFLSLQKGVPKASVPEELVDLSSLLLDFGETAAAMESLDLVIAVDTSVAHLAGAMGKQVWTLLPYAPDWRWLLHRDDSPWYPSMRLFRQPIAGDWRSVVRELRRALLDGGSD
ncbi:tetratricopeptide repeat protein [Bryobacter aggregatus]|uniref:tetratricopeptide repeat protein n=1 Tax=Bryobacter aggregatus TaxID=360054 RepID=UPI0006893676|nr:tetratricopeptide repeat protein [Bryobacter aggregatus]